jgi:hypothetical protein
LKKVRFLKTLVDAANEKTLSAKDKQGNTPLHLAVAYKMCREGQLEVVELIAQKSDGAVRATRNGDFNVAGQSPYLYHCVTRQKELEKEAAREQKDREGVDGKRRVGDEKDVSSRKVNTAKPVGPKPNTRPDASIQPPTANSGAAYAPRITIPEVDRTKFGELAPSGSSTPAPVAGSHPIPSLDSAPGPKSSKRPHLKDRGSESTSRSKVDEKTVKDVERFFRLHYLRSRYYDECMEILYGRNTPSGKLVPSLV